MGQAGKGLDHTNPSSPGSRKPALGTGGHYPPYSAGPGDPGGLGGRPARERQCQGAPGGVGTPPCPAPSLGPGWRFVRLHPQCQRNPRSERPCPLQQEHRKTSVQEATRCVDRAPRLFTPRPDRTVLSRPQPRAAGLHRSPWPPTLSSEGHSAPFLPQPSLPMRPCGNRVPRKATRRSALGDTETTHEERGRPVPGPPSRSAGKEDSSAANLTPLQGRAEDPSPPTGAGRGPIPPGRMNGVSYLRSRPANQGLRAAAKEGQRRGQRAGKEGRRAGWRTWRSRDARWGGGGADARASCACPGVPVPCPGPRGTRVPAWGRGWALVVRAPLLPSCPPRAGPGCSRGSPRAGRGRAGRARRRSFV